MVYKARYSPDGSLEGYTNFTLSYFSPSDFDPGPHQQHNNNSNSTSAAYGPVTHPEFCRYVQSPISPWIPIFVGRLLP